jgi:hypothetical protein
MRSIRTEPTMPRQPTKPTNLLISTPFQFLKQCQTRLFARLVWPGGARRTWLDQPLMVVVFVVVARAPTAAVVAEAEFRLNRRAWNMAEIVMDAA